MYPQESVKARPVFQVCNSLGREGMSMCGKWTHLRELKVGKVRAVAQTFEGREDAGVESSDAVRDVNGAREFF